MSSEIESRLRGESYAHYHTIKDELHDGLSAGDRAFHRSQSLLTLRHTRLTRSLLTEPPNSECSA